MINWHAGHFDTPFHTRAQAKKFFVLAKDLGYDEKTVKERAKKHFKVDCFNLITTNQLSELIDKLDQKLLSRSI